MRQVLGQLSGMQRLLRETLAAAMARSTLGGPADALDRGLRLGRTPIALQVRQCGQGGLR